MNAICIRSLFAVGLLIATGGVAVAQPVVQPSGLQAGDAYRLLFVTSSVRDANSTDIADYNAFVNNAAQSVPELAALNTEFRVIGSTESIDARDNIDFGGSSSTPIYLTDGSLVAANDGDLFDGEINVPTRYDETGEYISASFIYSGSTFEGVLMPALQPIISSEPHGLGNSQPNTGSVGNTHLGWIDVSPFLTTSDARFLGISDVLIAVPEPSSFALSLVVPILATTICRRFK